mgnify:CR=1 FL=1
MNWWLYRKICLSRNVSVEPTHFISSFVSADLIANKDSEKGGTNQMGKFSLFDVQ